jgi:hypothetical protein
MMRGVDQSAKAMRDAEIEDFLEAFKAHLPRQPGRWGPGGNLVEPAGHDRPVEANLSSMIRDKNFLISSTQLCWHLSGQTEWKIAKT